jgi:hypothetical protein
MVVHCPVPAKATFAISFVELKGSTGVVLLRGSKNENAEKGLLPVPLVDFWV